MQELVDHCAMQNQPEIVEAAVMHMDLTSLDLNQVSQSYISILHPSSCFFTGYRIATLIPSSN